MPEKRPYHDLNSSAQSYRKKYKNSPHRSSHPGDDSALQDGLSRPNQDQGGNSRCSSSANGSNTSCTPVTLEYLLGQIADGTCESVPQDHEIQRHARKLRSALLSCPMRPQSELKLHVEGPVQVPWVNLPSGDAPKQLSSPSGLPPLPEIKDETYRQAPFTHTSCLGGLDRDKLSYERLEFLGDAYIQIIATRLLYKQFPEVSEGRLSQLRERLVMNKALSHFSTQYGFPSRLKLANNMDTLPKSRTKILGDIFEAYVAAIILSDPQDGFARAEHWLTELWTPTLLQEASMKAPIIDARIKEKLAQKLVSPGIKLKYRSVKPMKMHKERGTQTFYEGVFLTGWGHTDKLLGMGEGDSKVLAQAHAVADAFENNGQLIQELNAIKIAHDAERRAEREAQAREEAAVKPQEESRVQTAWDGVVPAV